MDISKIQPHHQPGVLGKLSKETVYEYYAWKGIDPVAVVVDYFTAWLDKVPAGTQMILAKVKCSMADGPCGCAEDSHILKCKGVDVGIAAEIEFDVLFPPDGSPCKVEGLGVTKLPAPEAIVVDGTVHEVEFVGPHSDLQGGTAMAVYVTKL
jgi:hypothetical protein